MIENEGVRAEEARSCLLCGGEGAQLYGGLRDRLFNAPGNWSIMQCPKCQLVWLSPRPLPDDIGILYSHYHTHQALYAPQRSLAGLRKSVKSSILNSKFGYQMDDTNRIIGSILSRIGPLREIVGGGVLWLEAREKGRLLDVGCGNGSLLVQMRQLGWDVAGIEPDGKAVSVARERFGLEVFQGSLEEAKFPNEHFDAITMNHVIEHVQDPIGLLKECRRVIKPGGKIIVVTPNIQSLGFYLFGQHWRGLDIPRHLFLFSPHAFCACALQAGLTIQHLWTTARTAHWIWAASSLIMRGMQPGRSPEESCLSLKLQGVAFQTAEHLSLGLGKEQGEEIVAAMIIEHKSGECSNQ